MSGGLRVLVNAGPWLPVPPEGYGGIETVVATLVPELRRAGAHVTLATVGPSTLEADDHLRILDEPAFRSIAMPYNRVSGLAHAHMQGVVAALRDQDRWDVVHDHLEVVGPSVLGAMGTAAPPTLQTLHWDLRKHPEFYSRFDGRGRVRFAAVSASQLERAPRNLQEQTLGVVPLAAPPAVSVDVEPGEHALVLARITADKGQDLAARVCRRAGIPLVLAGPVAGIGDPAELERRLADGDEALRAHPDVQYWLDEVRPLVDGTSVRWVGGVAGEAKERLLRSARALLTPNRWAEPGATGVVEALSRGVPVVGTPLGVLPSLVEHGRTGFMAADEDELVRRLAELDRIDPRACREAAEQWTPAGMARQYLDLYARLLEANPS
ncbi:glycosyl transferase family 1 [Kocuria dechangensis]|uniref:Glycosyl transferase family 1 n=1 Tax=Kocuria dechangensis TaxID=1176249 RepID=A0A917H3D0_9MICC|nr:glycosyltransferase [Kocuria dechangensis]GGG66126.1 glycosyl transferase family 1 [Kocuria dechangensis]